jgi:hypothetical protein
MGNPNSVFFDYEGDMLDEGEKLEITPENPSGDDDEDDGTNPVDTVIGDTSEKVWQIMNPVDAVINETSEKVCGILDSTDDDDDDF